MLAQSGPKLLLSLAPGMRHSMNRAWIVAMIDFRPVWKCPIDPVDAANRASYI